MRGWKATSSGTFAVVATSLAVAGCTEIRQDAGEPVGKFPVSVVTASFPSSQHVSEHTQMVITIRNTGDKTIPELAVTICGTTCSGPQTSGSGTGAQPFTENLDQRQLANPARPVWVVDRPPGPCGFSCRHGGPGSNVTAYSNTWASGALLPGHTVRFLWGVTAVKPGHHVVAYEIAAGLNGKAKAVTAKGGLPHGTFRVTIADRPAQAYVDNGGGIVSSR